MKKRFALLMAAVAIGTALSVPPFIHAADAGSETRDIRILATSDLHGKFYPYDYIQNKESAGGSLVQIASAVKELRTADTVLIDCGDSIQDNAAELFLNDEIHPMILGMNEIGYDVWVTGNHEFNFGMDVLQRVISEQKATVLAGNVFNQDGSALADAYTILEKDGVKIGVIGMVTPNIVHWDAPNLEGCSVTNPVEETKKIIARIRDDVDILIAAEHMGENNEFEVSDSGVTDLAKACPELDLIIAAHEHKKTEGTMVNGVLIVENASRAATMAQVDFTVQKAGNGSYDIINTTSQLIDVSTYEADRALSKKLAAYDAKAKEDANEVIGRLTGGNLVKANEISGIPRAQIEDTPLVDLINEVQQYYAEADASATPLSAVDANLMEGDIKKSDLALIYKYSDSLYKMELTGAQLKSFLEWSAAYYNTYREGDLTVSFCPEMRADSYYMFSGVNYEINIANEPGRRIENLTKADKTPIADTEIITLAVDEYCANARLLSEGVIYREGESLPKVLDTDIRGDIGSIRELIRDYIVNVKGGEISPEMTPNWKITGNNWDEGMHRRAVELINEGRIPLENSENGRTPNIRSITVDDVEAAQPFPTATAAILPLPRRSLKWRGAPAARPR